MKFISDKKSRGRIVTEDSETFELLRAHYTVMNKEAKYSPYASPTTSAITPFGSFLEGHALDFIKTLKEINPNIEIDIDDKLKSAIYPFSYDGEITTTKH